MKKYSRSKGSAAFTLVELLVVLAVVATLMAIVLPTVASVRAKSQQSGCASNLRQLHAALSIYAADNDSLLPPYPPAPVPVWESCSQPPHYVQEPALLILCLAAYTRSGAVWHCPSDHLVVPAGSVSVGGLPVIYLTSYQYRGYDSNCSGGLTPLAVDHTMLEKRPMPVDRPLLSDAASCPNDGGTAYVQYNHRGRWNRIYLDGHIKSFGLNCYPDPSTPVETL